MKYYTKDENGNINAYRANPKYLTAPIYETEENILYGHDGGLYLESELPEAPPPEPPPPPTEEELLRANMENFVLGMMEGYDA